MKVELRDIRKYYGPVRANDGVTVCVQPGSIHGLLGENGAGKSTLMKILTGFIRADGGEIILDGQRAPMASPAEAVSLGVGMLHQDPQDFPALPVVDDFLLGSPGNAILDRRVARQALGALARRFDFDLDPDAAVSSLSMGERQQLEIVRLLWLGVDVLVLDEPTTAISAQQKAKLFAALRQLAADGKSVIFVSHKLEEVAELCHRVTVLARGRVAGEVEMPCPMARLVQLMFGQEVARLKRLPTPLGVPAVALQQLRVSDWRLSVEALSLEVRAGEVIGLAGLEGSGQRLVLQACSGLRKPDSGRVLLAGRDMAGKPYRHFLREGASFVPAARLEEGLIPGMTITEHVALGERRPGLMVDWAGAGREAAQRISRYNVKGRPGTRVEELSGGNQQRTLLGLLPADLKLLLMEHPTRGLDIESSEYIWGLLMERTRGGTAIIYASSDLDELLDRSDRILIFFSGRVAERATRELSGEELGELIGGKGF